MVCVGGGMCVYGGGGDGVWGGCRIRDLPHGGGVSAPGGATDGVTDGVLVTDSEMAGPRAVISHVTHRRHLESVPRRAVTQIRAAL